MNRELGLKAIAILLACLAMSVPVITAISLVEQQATRAEDRFILQYARDTLRRSEQTADQLVAASREINALPPALRCSERGLQLMRRIDLRSTLLQAVGHAEGDRMLCSSFSGPRPIPLGPPDFSTANKADIRTDLRLFRDDPAYVAVTMRASVGIVHKQLVLSFVDQVPGLMATTFSWSARRAILQRGTFDPRWIDRPLTDAQVFRQGPLLIGIVRSRRYDLGAVAAIPETRTSDLAWQASVILIPLGLATGTIFALLMIYVVRSRFSLPSLIQAGLKRQEFSLLYQPVVDLATGRTIGTEALMRWERANGERVPPDIFISAAEKAGLARAITGRLLHLVAHDLGHWAGLPTDFHIGINLSADDMHSDETVSALRALIDGTGLTGANLMVEATERSFVDVTQAHRIIDALRGLGIEIAIDDFGTGYSSLGYIATLNVDYLKIDKLFVHALGTDSATSVVAGRIIDMARDLALDTIAEGVETEAQAAILRQLGVRYAQGWLFGRPMPIEDLLQRIRAERNAGATAGAL